MKKQVWSFSSLALIIVVTLSLAACRDQEPPAKVVEVVNVVDAHARPEDEWEPAAVGMAVYGGGQVRTHAASAARLGLLEGVVRLSAETLFTVKESTTRGERLATTLFLDSGRVWVNLTTDKPHQFTVETGSAAAVVRDTRFSVQVMDGRTLISVAEGEVELTAQEQTVVVSAGQQAEVQPGQPPSVPEPMGTEERALWAAEGGMPELAPPPSTPTPTVTATPTPTPTSAAATAETPTPTPAPGATFTATATPSPVPTVTPPSLPSPTPAPGPIQTEGEGLIITLKPGHPGSLPADGESQTVLLVDVNPNAACWGGPDVVSGQIYILAETSLGAVSWPGPVDAGELPGEVSLTAGTTRGQAVISVEGAYCPKQEIIVLGVCTDPAAEDRRCAGKAIVTID